MKKSKRKLVHTSGAFFATDIASFNDPKRTDTDLVTLRRALQQYVEEAFQEADVRYEQKHHADGGDAILLISKPDADKTRLLLDVLPALEKRVLRHNRESSEPLQLRLRLAIHFGEYSKDSPSITKTGIAGREINKTFRLLDAKLLRQVVSKDKERPISCLVSDEFYQKVLLQHAPEQSVRLRPGMVDTKDGVEFQAWAYGFDPSSVLSPAMTLAVANAKRTKKGKKGSASRAAPSSRELSVLQSFTTEMDSIWEQHFDSAWEAIHTIDYTTERTLTLKLDLFFQQYHRAVWSLIHGGSRGDGFRRTCRASVAAAWDLAASSWELIANARMKAAHHLAELSGNGSRPLLHQADAANRRGQEALSPKEKCARFKESVDLLRQYVESHKAMN